MEGMVSYTQAAVERAMKVQEVILRAMARKITWWEAAEIIGISDRQMRRWRERYEEFGFRGCLIATGETFYPETGLWKAPNAVASCRQESTFYGLPSSTFTIRIEGEGTGNDVMVASHTDDNLYSY